LADRPETLADLRAAGGRSAGVALVAQGGDDRGLGLARAEALGHLGGESLVN
jgi:hypothetical protein